MILRGFADASVTAAIHDAAVDLARRDAAQSTADPNSPFVLPEANLRGTEVSRAEQAVSKVFRVHREEPFRSFATDPDLVATVAGLIETDELSCFL
ncbi:MAG TPA: hypothetical protein VGI86_20750, partial [Acidimicrobiia bacterium]